MATPRVMALLLRLLAPLSLFTVFSANDAKRNARDSHVLDVSHWPLIAPLPSYGRGRERPGESYVSFIHGDGLQDVIITGENGTIDGQGVWWEMWRQRTLRFTRPNLIEFMHSKNIITSNVIFKNSPFWNILPIYSR